MPRKRSSREIAAIAAKSGLVSGLDPLKRSNEDDRYLLNLRAASNPTLSKSVRQKAFQKAENIGNDEMLRKIIGKRTLELRLKGVKHAEAMSIANEQIQKESGLTPKSIASPV